MGLAVVVIIGFGIVLVAGILLALYLLGDLIFTDTSTTYDDQLLPDYREYLR